MTPAISASSLRFDRMSPPALALAVVLHAAVALALWWMSQSPPQLPLTEVPPEHPIEVTIEQPKPPPPPAPAEQPPPAPPVLLGLPPPAAITAEKPTQVPPKSEQPPEPPKPIAPPEPPAMADELPKAALPPPAKPNPPPATARQPTPQPPPAVARAEVPSPSPLVNPADVLNRARVSDNYLWQVVGKLSGYRYKASAPVGEILTVVRITIARDGRLLAIDIARSSGFPAIDAGVLAGVRAGSPYAPLPPEIPGPSATFTLPLVSRNLQ